MSLETSVHIVSISLGLLAFCSMVFAWGKWTEKVTAYENQLDKLNRELASYETRFVMKELYEDRHTALLGNLAEIKGTIQALERTNVTILIALGRMEKNAQTNNLSGV